MTLDDMARQAEVLIAQEPYICGHCTRVVRERTRSMAIVCHPTTECEYADKEREAAK
jgi:hypothetical protein